MILLRKLRAFFRKGKLDAEMSDEMRAHLELQAERNRRAGMNADDARYAAQRGFGGVEQIKERARDQRGSKRLEQLGQNLRFATRQFARAPSFTAVVVLTFAVGIGATTAIFTVINAIMVRPLPVRAASELVVVELPFVRPGLYEPASRRLYREFRERGATISDAFVLGEERTRPFVLMGVGASEVDFVRVEPVTGNFFDALGVAAIVGRPLLPADDQSGADTAIVVISHAFWQQRFGSDPAVIGQKVRIEQGLFTIVGVAATGFSGLHPGSRTDVWCPTNASVLLDPERGVPSDDQYFGTVVARLRPGVSREQAQVELAGIFRQNLERLKNGKTSGDGGWQRYFLGRTLRLKSAATGINPSGGLRDQLSPTLLALGGASAIVLLVACANVASLFLARGEARQREFAVRAALGAGRRRLFAQLLHESLQLSLAGGLLGVGLAHAATAWLATFLASEYSAVDLAPDGRVLAFSVLLVTVTGLLSGLTPAVHASRVDLTTAFKRQAATIAGGSQRLNAMLVVGQIALSFMLLVAAGLFGRTLQDLRTLDLGFARDRLMLMAVHPGKAYSGATAAELYRRILARIESLPDVSGATMATGTFLNNRVYGSFSIDGDAGAKASSVIASGMEVGPRFFATTGARLVSGRDFAERDFTGTGPPPLIVSESLARRFFPEVDPIGHQFKRGIGTSEIIGVARDIQYESLREATPFATYIPFIGRPGEEARPMVFHVRAALEPATLAPSLRTIVHELEPAARITALHTMEAFIDETLLRERALTQLSGFFSGFSLLLASLGLYGFMSYGVVRRTREIGVRVALGAQARDVAELFLRRGLWLVLCGCFWGIAGALAGTRLIGSLLHGVSPMGVSTLATAALVMLVIGVLACWLPARRAAKVDPMVALRAE